MHMAEPPEPSDEPAGDAGAGRGGADPGASGAAARRRGVPADVVAFVRSEHLTRKAPLESTARLVFTFAAIGALGAAAVMTSSWPLRIVLWVVSGLLFMGAVAGEHEAIHGNMFHSKLANEVAGFFCGALVLLYPWAAYRASHFDHHRWTRAPGDTEPVAVFRSVPEYLIFAPIGSFYVWGYHWVITLRTMAGRPPAMIRTAHQRRLTILNGYFLLAIGAAVVACAVVVDWRPVVYGWLAPALVFGMFFAPMAALPEHYELPYGPDSPLVTSRSIRSNPIMRFAYWGTNFHASHHLVSTVPSQRLHLLDDYLGDRRVLEQSYLGFHIGLLGRLRRKEVYPEPYWEHVTFWDDAPADGFDDSSVATGGTAG